MVESILRRFGYMPIPKVSEQDQKLIDAKLNLLNLVNPSKPKLLNDFHILRDYYFKPSNSLVFGVDKQGLNGIKFTLSEPKTLQTIAESATFTLKDLHRNTYHVHLNLNMHLNTPVLTAGGTLTLTPTK